MQIEEIFDGLDLIVGHSKSTLLWITPVCRPVTGEVGHLGFGQRLQDCAVGCLFVLQDIDPGILE
jgi:hypothetical protein